MQFFNKTYLKQINFSIPLFKVVTIFIIFIILPFLYIKTANAGLFSFISDLSGDKASAKTIEFKNIPNSQNMSILQASVNIDPNPNKALNDGPLVMGNTIIAEIGPSGTANEIEEENDNTQISLYIVHEGDTLSQIAKMFNVSVNTIIWSNDISRNSVLKEGQKLIILPISGLRYTIKKGDTIKGIVSKYKSDLKEVLQFNDLTLDSVLNPGDIIVIPDAEPIIDQTSRTLTRRSTSNSARGTDGPFYPGYYERPIDGGRKSQGFHGTNGIDLAAPVGTPIHAAAEGIVIASVTGGWHGGYGNYVIISHINGTQTVYAHNLKNFVSVGDNVEKGQMIAKIGMTGRTTGPHVHFEIRGARNPF